MQALNWVSSFCQFAAKKTSLGPLKTSRLGMGTGTDSGMREGNHSKMGEKALGKLILGAYDEGIRFFDCADLYGTHEMVGKALASKNRDSYQLCSKVWLRRGNLPESDRPISSESVDRFLKEFDTDFIDLVQLHAMVDKDWPSKYRRHMDALDKLKNKGIIRAHGVSCHSLDALKTAAAEPWVDVIHVRLNPFGVRMDAAPEEVVPVLFDAKKEGKGIIVMKLSGGGDFNKSQRAESIRFALALGMDCLLMGVESESEYLEFNNIVSEALKDRNPSN